MPDEKLFSFDELAGELSISTKDLARIIRESDGKLPVPSVINRLTDECFFTEKDYNTIKASLERSTLTPEEFFKRFDRRGRPPKNSGTSTPKKKILKGTGKRGRPKKQTKE